MRHVRLPRYTTIATAILLACGTHSPAGPVDVDVNLNVVHSVGGVSTFDRSKFIVLHSDPIENEWNHGSGTETNFTPDLLSHFIDGYDVYFGRNTGTIGWTLNQIVEDPLRPGYADPAATQAYGAYIRNNYANNTAIHPYEARNLRGVVTAQLHPYWPDGTLTGQGWAFSTADTPSEPFGTASGEHIANFLKYFHGGNGQPLPGYYAVINEPLYWLSDMGSTPPSDVFAFHNTVAAEIRKLLPTMKIGGYTTAHPNFEVDNFQR